MCTLGTLNYLRDPVKILSGYGPALGNLGPKTLTPEDVPRIGGPEVIKYPRVKDQIGITPLLFVGPIASSVPKNVTDEERSGGPPSTSTL